MTPEMETPTILYLNGKYCSTLADLQDALQKGDQMEILAAYKDGSLAQWLVEGDEPCQKAHRRLTKRNFNGLGNNELLEQIALAINNSNNAPNTTIKYDIDKLIELTDTKWIDGDGKEYAVARGGTIPMQKKAALIRLKYIFKIKEPENDALHFRLRIINNIDKATVMEQTGSLPLGKLRNSIETVAFVINTDKLARGTYSIVLLHGENEICRFLAYCNSVLHFGPHSIKMAFIPNDNDSFYISEKPISDIYGHPMTGIPYSSICTLLNEWESTYGVEFQIPTFTQWTLAMNSNLLHMPDKPISEIVQDNGNARKIITDGKLCNINAEAKQNDLGFRLTYTHEHFNKLMRTYPKYFL